jgi:general secretion pathway protein N
MSLALLLSAVLALQWRGWAPEADLPAPPAASAEPSGSGARAASDRPGVALEPPPKDDYASVIDRPLFLPDRRPPPEEGDDTEIEDVPLTELDGVDLTAVVITPAVVSAWVRSPEDDELKRLRLGDELMGWTVQTIAPDELVLERQGETNRLSLRDYQNAPPPIPPTRLPPRRQTRGADPDQQRRDAAARRRAELRQEAPGAEADGRSSDDDAVQGAPNGRQPIRRADRPTSIRQPPRRLPTRQRDATATSQ